MKRVFLGFLLALVSVSTFAQLSKLAGAGLGKATGTDDVALTISFANSVVYDGNIKLQFAGRHLYATNLTNKTIYIDKRATSINENGSVYNLSTNNTTMEAPIAIAPNSKMNLCSLFGYFGDRTYDVTQGGSYNKINTGLYSLKNLSTLRPFTDREKILLNNINKMVIALSNSDNLSTSLHMTEDESFMTMIAHIRYSLNENMSDAKSITLSSWACDAVLSAADYEFAQKQKASGIAVDDDVVYGDKLTLYAKQIFETEKDVSPVISLWVDVKKINKGKLVMRNVLKTLEAKSEIQAGGAPLGGLVLNTFSKVGIGNGTLNIIWQDPSTLDAKTAKELLKSFKKNFK